ncbi:MAG: hypothetical protein NTW29_10685 [Bacteroidetes bacterium]|nr:hypothetical protein [Bacteroidota bacterium]
MSFIILQSAFAAKAQLKIGDNPTAINANSIIEMETTNKVMLLPRVALTATNNFARLSAHLAGMTVYNTAIVGTLPNNVTPGNYYNDGTQWVRVLDRNIYNADGTIHAATN